MATLAEPSPTVDRLLDAAERLIAERGVEGVSLRAVNAAAGANVAAVHYHFGSKDALVDAVLRRRMDRLAARRRAMLGALDGLPRPSVRAVVEALVLPLAELSRDPDGAGRTYVRFLAALQAGGPLYRARMGACFAPQFAPLDAALARALPGLPAGARHFRLGLAGELVINTLADPERVGRPLTGSEAPPSHDEVVAALVDAVAGTIEGPHRKRRGRKGDLS